MAALGVGETLPLFDHGEQLSATSNTHSAAENTEAKQPKLNLLHQKQHGAVAVVPTSAQTDRHMQAAWQLAKALKAAKTGKKSGRKIAKLTPGQRHQVGNAICEHLLASLRQQVDAERNAATNVEKNAEKNAEKRAKQPQ